MNRFRWPIYLKMLLLFSVNLLLLVGLVYGFMREQFRLQLDWMLAGPSGERIERLAETLSDELGRNPQEEWAAVLRRYGKAHGITFALFGSDGRSLVGESDKIPREVLIKLIDKRSPTGKLRPPHPPRLEARVETLPNQPKPRFMLRGGDPARYWAGIHLNLFFLEDRAYLPGFLPDGLLTVTATTTSYLGMRMLEEAHGLEPVFVSLAYVDFIIVVVHSR